jgi:hypothetical protein
LGKIAEINLHNIDPRLSSKAKDNPAMSGGIALGVGFLCYMAWGLTHRKPGEKLSVYLIHTRLGVQGAIIGSLAAAMTYQLYR